MLVGLIFRGVAFEFRFKANDRERPSGTWPSSAARWRRFFQGVSLGAFLDGIRCRGAAMRAARSTGSRRSRWRPAAA
jgi:cytochrome d ubiquinol oxidase subunit II